MKKVFLIGVVQKVDVRSSPNSASDKLYVVVTLRISESGKQEFYNVHFRNYVARVARTMRVGNVAEVDARLVKAFGGQTTIVGERIEQIALPNPSEEDMQP